MPLEPAFPVKTRGDLRRRLATAAAAAALVGGLVALDALAQTDAKTAEPSFFNSQETRSNNLKPFTKWTEAVARYSKEEAEQKKGGCDAKKFTKCHYDDWVKFLDGIRGKDKPTQIDEVNRYMNKAKYITDDVNWGAEDYWATPAEFFSKFGDCEDYAIAKYLSLKALGFSEDSLRVVAVKDMNLKVGHAILAVFVDGKVLILDNQIKQVVEAKTIRHYQPVFSLNQQFWWRHRV